ncbi:MAG: DNA mismatch repair endonuclease MutL [Syntrophomonadaceae bacterium]|nr:DNA mismatch repair endonuclease MutL [Syntrophomonadaceae bacterium]
MTIRLLDDHLINKIAAGEVIERPASIVKELVENAIDAGSRRIAVQIAGGGIDRIEVADDGQGIPRDQVLMAFERHATSKIGREEDLTSIATMGFRGEALPSIASVSEVELHTQYGQEAGVRVSVSGGKNIRLDNSPAAPGTKVTVTDLFFNTPARKKFLKSMVSEGIQVHDVMCHLALARPDISFSYANEKKLYFKTPGSGDLRDTVVAIYGHDFAAHFIDLDWQGERYRLRGLMSKPEFRRLNRKNQLFYVNDRLIKSPMLARAVDEGYRGALLTREYAAVFLFLYLPGEEVDVNVHPQKTEVRFRDDKAIFRLVSQALKAALGGPGLTDDHRPLHPSGFPRPSQPAPLRLDWPHDPQPLFIAETGPQVIDSHIQTGIGWDGRDADRGTPDSDLVVIGQCFNGYIIIERGDSIWLVDQHAAHERIIYNRLREQGRGQTEEGQILAFPQAFDLSAAAMDMLEDHLDVFRTAGFDLEPLGPDSVILRAAPAALQGQEVEFVNECLDVLAMDQAINFKDEIYALMACKQAVKAGDLLSRAEMMLLVDDLLRNRDYGNCPHGRPTLVEISRSELEKRFKRK